MATYDDDTVSEFGAAQSVVSSQMPAEDTDIYKPQGQENMQSQNQSEDKGRSATSFSPQSPPSRHDNRAARRGIGFGGSGLSMANTSRPQSAVSRRSNNRGPTITSQAFFRPMSSQRLQAQRGARSIAGTNQDSSDVPRLSTSTMNRPSMESSSAVPPLQEVNIPPSRGTDVTESDIRDRDRAYYNSSPTGENTIRTGDSSQPLNGQSTYPQETLDRNSRSPKTPKTPQSFASKFPQPQPAALQMQSAQQSRISHDTNPTPLEDEKMNSHSFVSHGKNYEYFSGNTIFCWGGRLQNTRHRPINILTGFLIILPAVLFFTFSASWLWHNVSPALPIVCAYLFYICLSSFLHASVTDPGILPRNLHPLPRPDTDDPLAIGPSLNDWTMVKSTNPDNTAMDVPTKYCKTCNIWRPLRAHHCRLCDSCIETQDHHCVWLNNCIGRRNYRYFFAFVSSATILGLFVGLASLGQCIAYSSQMGVSFGNAIDKNRVPFAMFLYGIIVVPYPVSLLAYHLFLMGRGETTREYLYSHDLSPKDRHRPFDQRKIITNWLSVLLRSRTPTYLQFKDKYMEGDPRFGPRRGRRQAPLAAEQQGGGMEMQNVPGSHSFHGGISQKLT